MKSTNAFFFSAVLITSLLGGYDMRPIAPPHQFELMPADSPKMKSEGVYHVGWIKAFIPNDNSNVQMIPIEMDEPDSNWPQWGLTKKDVDFDGYLDIAVSQHGGAKWGRLHWYLYNPKKMEFYSNNLSRELSQLTCASFKTDPITKQIIVARFRGIDTKECYYQINDEHLAFCGSKWIIFNSSDKPGHVNSEFHIPPDKWDKPRTYHTPINDISYDDKIIFSHIQPMLIKDKTFSANGAYWFALVKRTDENLKVNESLYVYNERTFLVEITVSDIDHRYDGKAYWINEKLIYYQWWWGRLLGGYLIFDVEAEQIIQKQFVKDGSNVFQQFQQAKKEKSKK